MDVAKLTKVDSETILEMRKVQREKERERRKLFADVCDELQADDLDW